MNIKRHVLQVDFPSRADAIAALADEERPDLIGLQEVALWQKRGPRIPADTAGQTDDLNNVPSTLDHQIEWRTHR